MGFFAQLLIHTRLMAHSTQLAAEEIDQLSIGSQAVLVNAFSKLTFIQHNVSCFLTFDGHFSHPSFAVNQEYPVQTTTESSCPTLRSFQYSRIGFSWRTALLAVSVAASAMLSTAALADPPSRVGRVGYIEGDVSFYADRTEGWQKARVNFPVTNENSVWTENQSRAEVRIGGSSVRLGENSILDFLTISDDRTDTFLQRGALIIRTRADNQSRDSFRVETNDGRFLMEGSGRFRIEAAQDGAESRISVFGGRARYEGGNSVDNRLTIEPGKMLIIRNPSAGRASGGSMDFRFEPANESELDHWANSRDQRWDETHTRYVREQTISPYMTGYEDLDANGDWVEDREYGRIWTPRVVVAGWAPYRYGSWAYVRPWGWTWVDDAAWGFAPFHYGRWVYAGTRWAWWPGAYARRPIYAPALVGWYGGAGRNLGPSIGWFPLAPREHFIPGYTNNVTYIRNINHITNNITIINPPARYANQIPGATFVNGQTFLNARPVQNNTIKVSAKERAEHPTMVAPATPTAAPFAKEMGSRTQSGQNNAPPPPAQGQTQPPQNKQANGAQATPPNLPNARNPNALPNGTNGGLGSAQNNLPSNSQRPGKPLPEPISGGAQNNNGIPPIPAMPREFNARTSPPMPQPAPQPAYGKPPSAASEVVAHLPNGGNADSTHSIPTPTYHNKQNVQREGRASQPAAEGAIQGRNFATPSQAPRVERRERPEQMEKPVKLQHEKIEKIDRPEKSEKREPEVRGKLENR